MPVPSTATATLPPIHNPHYGYSSSQRHDSSQATAGAYDTSRGNFSRLGTSYMGYSNHNNNNQNSTRDTTTSTSRPPPPPPAAPMARTQTSPAARGARKTNRRPNWAEFYKNGIPDQVIYIDVTPEPPKPESQCMNQNNRTSIRVGTTPEPVAKKRRTGPTNNFDSRNYSYSNQRHTHLDDSGSGTVSTDRTASQHTTAQTSLGSIGSHGSQGAHLDDQQTGQKRKRVTRQQTANEKKRREIDTVGDAYSSYVPPPNPPIRGTAVHVPRVKDVGSLQPLSCISLKAFST